MDFQPKTTILRIAVGHWTEKTDRSLSDRFSAGVAVAVQIASRCQMDIMSFTPSPLKEEGEDLILNVVYANNGRSPGDIQRLMKPEMDQKTAEYWIVQDLYEWQGLLECIVAVRGNDETWD